MGTYFSMLDADIESVNNPEEHFTLRDLKLMGVPNLDKVDTTEVLRILNSPKRFDLKYDRSKSMEYNAACDYYTKFLLEGFAD